MNKKSGIIIGALAALLLLTVGGFFYFINDNRKRGEAEVVKTFSLAKNYAENKEFIKALAILETLEVTEDNNKNVTALILHLTSEKAEYDRNRDIEKKKLEEKNRIEKEERLINSLLQSQKEQEKEELKTKIRKLLVESHSVLENNQFKEADIFRKEVLKLDPGNIEAKQLKDLIAAKEIELENKNERDQRLKRDQKINDLVLKAKKKLEDMDLDTSDTLFNKVLLMDEDNTEALKGLADISIKKSETDKSEISKAIKRILQVLDEEPGNLEYLKSLADLYEKKCNMKEELEVLNKILKIDPTAEYYVKAGIASYKITEYDHAISYFNTAIKLDPEYPDIYYPFALTYDKKEDNINREKMLILGMKKRPRHGATYYELGRYYTDREMFDKALVLFLKAQKLKENSVKYRMGVALAYFNLNQLTKSIDIYESIIRLDQTISEVYYNLSMARMKTDDYYQALTDISMAIKLKPGSPTYLYTIGQISEALGRDDNAIKYYENAIRFDSSYYKPMLNLGNIYDRQGSYKDGLILLKKSYKLNPDDPDVRFSLGTSYLHNKEYKKSLDLLEEAHNMDKNSPLKLYNLSLAYTEVGEGDKAEEGFKKVIEMDSNIFDAYFYLGQLLYSLGRKDEARTYFEQVLELDSEYSNKEKILELL